MDILSQALILFTSCSIVGVLMAIDRAPMGTILVMQVLIAALYVLGVMTWTY